MPQVTALDEQFGTHRGYPLHRPAPLVGPLTPDMICEQATFIYMDSRTSPPTMPVPQDNFSKLTVP
jgi:hypothetical protein